MLYECGDGVPLVLVINPCGKRMQTKEAFVTITRKESCPSHPIRSWTIQVGPALAYCIVHQLSGHIDLKPLPTMLLEIIFPCNWTNVILGTINYCHIQLMHLPVQQPKEDTKIPPVGP
jgi:hypothetical protein